MRCERVHRHYEAYSRGTLPWVTLGRIEEHLGACRKCLEYYDQNDELAAWMKASSDVAHPGEVYFERLTKRVMDRLDTPGTEDPPAVTGPARRLPAAGWRRPIWWAGGMAAAALMAMICAPRPSPTTGSVVPSETMSGQAVQGRSGRTGTRSERMELADASRERTPAPGEREVRQLAFVPASGVVSEEPTHSGSKSFDKSVEGMASNSTHVEAMIGPPEEPTSSRPNRVPFEEPTSAERAARQEAEQRVITLNRAAEQGWKLPTEIYEQIQVVKAQLHGDAGGELTRHLQELEAVVEEQMVDPQALEHLPIVRQAQWYVRAQNALKGGRPREAWSYFRRTMKDDAHSSLAIRACLQVADLYYSEWADFEKAAQYYRRCQGRAAAEALTSPERDHVRKRLDRIDKFEPDQWQALTLLHVVRRQGWRQVRPALRSLLARPDADELMPETARAIVERMDTEDLKPPPDVMVEIYNLLANRTEHEENGDIRAWLELALGDMLISQFNEPRNAMSRYQQVLRFAEHSMAAEHARSKLARLREASLQNALGRN